MGERRGTRGLELWCRRMTQGYPGVEVNNMTTSWRDGLAFCAIIHHFRPDLIDFSKLNKNDVYHNNDLAFQVAKLHLGIPDLLDPADMVEYAVPDRLSILTYLSQFYRAFGNPEGSPSRISPKRPTSTVDRGGSPVSKTSSPKISRRSTTDKDRREPCTKCSQPVFIAQHLNIGKQIYHRTCFRCARCNNQLTLANYYETEVPNQFCCEICPDEEKLKMEEHEKIILNRSLSDDEKKADLSQVNDCDDYSSVFESALENPDDDSLLKCDTLTKTSDFQFAKSRLEFTIGQLVESENSSNSDVEATEQADSFIKESQKSSLSEDNINDSGFPSSNIQLDVNSRNKISDVSDSNQPETATDKLDINKIVTKDNTFPSQNQSLVKSRMRLFETKIETEPDISETNENDTKLEDVETHSINTLGLNSIKSDIQEEYKNIQDDSIITILDTLTISSDCQTSFDTTSCPSETSILVISSDINDASVILIKEETLETSPIVISSYISDESVASIKEEIPAVVISSYVNNESVTSIKEEIPETSPLGISSNKNDESVTSTKEDYPDDLNPFDDDDTHTLKPSQNPFDDEDDESVTTTPIPAVRKKVKVLESGLKISGTNSDSDTPEFLKKTIIQRISVNPLEKKAQTLKLISAPKISLNPFWSDGEEPDEEEEVKSTNTRNMTLTPEPKPRKLHSSLKNSSLLGSNTSLSSTQSTSRKKKPAPKPPTTGREDSAPSSITSSPSPSVSHSPKLTPKLRKFKKAPPPPLTSTPQDDTVKSHKDEINRNRQSWLFSDINTTQQDAKNSAILNKSIRGKWKRRKGPAPLLPVPIPKRRSIKPLPEQEIKHELEVIEIQLQGLEKQGVALEKIIREKSEGPDINLDSPLSIDVDDLILQLFELVNEKNELFRKQAEFMYLRRQKKLEEEHADLEYQIRLLMNQSESTKTDTHKAKEEELITRLVEIVERRNEIVQCLDMDRVRETEEDLSINCQLNLYTLKRDETLTKSALKEQKHKSKKGKKLLLKLSNKTDIDKDIDESEVPKSSNKSKKKKKFNLF